MYQIGNRFCPLLRPEADQLIRNIWDEVEFSLRQIADVIPLLEACPKTALDEFETKQGNWREKCRFRGQI